MFSNIYHHQQQLEGQKSLTLSSPNEGRQYGPLLQVVQTVHHSTDHSCWGILRLANLGRMPCWANSLLPAASVYAPVASVLQTWPGGPGP